MDKNLHLLLVSYCFLPLILMNQLFRVDEAEGEVPGRVLEQHTDGNGRALLILFLILGSATREQGCLSSQNISPFVFLHR